MKQKTCSEIIAETEEKINNTPVLKAACEYSESVKKPVTIYGFGKVALIEAFQAGAEWETKQSLWISIDEQFPEDKQPVLCSSQIYGKVVLCWDGLSQSWSYPESGEFYCDWDKVDCWMLIPEV